MELLDVGGRLVLFGTSSGQGPIEVTTPNPAPADPPLL